MAKFLGRKLTEDQFSKLTEHSYFENFSKNEWVNYEQLKKYGIMKRDGKFIRKGMIIFTNTCKAKMSQFFKFIVHAY